MFSGALKDSTTVEIWALSFALGEMWSSVLDAAKVAAGNSLGFQPEVEAVFVLSRDSNGGKYRWFILRTRLRFVVRRAAT